MRYRSLLAGPLALALTLSLVACGDDDGDGDDATTTTTTEAEAATETTEAEETEADETEDETEETDGEEEVGSEDLTGLLVTEADLPGFTEVEYETSTEPNACGVRFSEEYPYEDIVGTNLIEEELQLLLQHELRTYADEDTAMETFAASVDALSCGEEALEGLVLSDPVDLTDDVGAPAYVIEVTADDGTDGALVAVQVGAVVSVYQFQGPADVEEGPDPLAVVQENVTLLQDQLG